MDILSHLLWTALACKAVSHKKKVKIWAAGAWGILPDIIAFIPLAIWIAMQILGSSITITDVYNEDLESGSKNFLYDARFLIYPMTHSIPVFIIAFAIVSFVSRRIIWEMGGWLMHIIIDIPTHGSANAVQFLWPLSAFAFQGIYWREMQFMAVNYGLLAAVCITLYRNEIMKFITERLSQIRLVLSQNIK